QVNPSMGLVVSPDIKRGAMRDLYTHISTIPDPEKETEWSDPEIKQVKMGERFFVNDYVAVLKGVERVYELRDIEFGENDVAVKAIIEIMGDGKEYTSEPVFIVKDNMIGNMPEFIEEIGLKINFSNVLPEEDSFELTLQ